MTLLKMTKKSYMQVYALLLAGLAAGCSGRDGVQAAKQAPVAPVTVATVATRSMPVQVQAIGNVEAISTVSIKAQISGQLVGVHFQEGDFVKKGQLLFTIDRAPFEADLRRAEGTLAKDQAQAENARIDAERYQGLGREGVVSRQQVESAQAAYNALAAASAADKANVETAKINLEYTTIYSPITGRTGNVAVKQGNLVKANDVPVLVTINQIEPIYVSFSIPEQQLAELKKYSAGRALTVQASLQGSGERFDGKLSFIDNAVDLTTGTIKLKATFDNRQHALWPGQYVDCSLTLTNQPDAVVIPTAAVQTGQSGTYVYVVEQDLTARLQPIKIARTMGDDTVISSGLKPGQIIVTDGQLQVLPGNKVSIKSRS